MKLSLRNNFHIILELEDSDQKKLMYIASC